MSNVCPCQSQKSEYFICPKLANSWRCCDEESAIISRIVEHVEWNHLRYLSSFQGNHFINQIFKYKCSHCNENYLTYNDAMSHFLAEHIKYTFRCLTCLNHFEPTVASIHAQTCHATKSE